MTPLDPPAGPVLVVAPHPDDETLGCGALIAAGAARGAPLQVLFVTDGGASHPNSRLWPRARLAQARRAEAEEALARLGASDAARGFLDLPDAAMPPPGSPAYARALEIVVAALRAAPPRLALLPWRLDPHRDHRDSWALARAALTAAGQAPELLEYAIWQEEIGAAADHPAAHGMEPVYLPAAPALKRHALEAHASQLGGLITDDPAGFALAPATIARLTGAREVYWRCAAR